MSVQGGTARCCGESAGSGHGALRGMNGTARAAFGAMAVFGIGNAVQAHPSRDREASLRGAKAADGRPVPESGFVEGLTVGMMGGRVGTNVAG